MLAYNTNAAPGIGRKTNNTNPMIPTKVPINRKTCRIIETTFPRLLGLSSLRGFLDPRGRKISGIYPSRDETSFKSDQRSTKGAILKLIGDVSCLKLSCEGVKATAMGGENNVEKGK